LADLPNGDFGPSPTSVANVDAPGSSLTPEHLMDFEQAATAPLPVSQAGVEIAGMPM
jgi:hypothetical protein